MQTYCSKLLVYAKHSFQLSTSLTGLTSFFACFVHALPNFRIIIGNCLAHGNESFYSNIDGLAHARYRRRSQRTHAAMLFHKGWNLRNNKQTLLSTCQANPKWFIIIRMPNTVPTHINWQDKIVRDCLSNNKEKYLMNGWSRHLFLLRLKIDLYELNALK